MLCSFINPDAARRLAQTRPHRSCEVACLKSVMCDVVCNVGISDAQYLILGRGRFACEERRLVGSFLRRNGSLDATTRYARCRDEGRRLRAAVRSLTLRASTKMFFTWTCTVSSLMPSERGDLLVPHALGDQLHHLDFPRRQRRAARRSSSRAWTSGANRAFAGVNIADHPNQVVGERVLQQVGRGAGRERPVDVFVALVHRQARRCARRAIARADGTIASSPLIVAQLKIHQRDVGPLLASNIATASSPLAAEADHLHVGLAVDDQTRCLPGRCDGRRRRGREFECLRHVSSLRAGRQRHDGLDAGCPGRSPLTIVNCAAEALGALPHAGQPVVTVAAVCCLMLLPRTRGHRRIRASVTAALP